MKIWNELILKNKRNFYFFISYFQIDSNPDEMSSNALDFEYFENEEYYFRDSNLYLMCLNLLWILY